MTTHKDFKRLVRRRMQKTGEAYTAARAKLLQRKTSPESRGRRPELSHPTTPDYAKLAGMSNAAVKAKTGCTWERWVAALDYARAYEWPHSQIAEYVGKKFKVGDWWTQTVTVGYERIKGLRVRGQQRSGSFRISKSKTYPVAVSRLYRAWTDSGLRDQWLRESGATVRSGQPNKVIRFNWPDGSSVEARFTVKTAAKSQVAIEHSKLPSAEAADRFKVFWTGRLERLARQLDGKGGPD